MKEDRVLMAFLVAMAILLSFVIALHPIPAKAALYFGVPPPASADVSDATTTATTTGIAAAPVATPDQIAQLNEMIRELRMMLAQLEAKRV